MRVLENSTGLDFAALSQAPALQGRGMPKWAELADFNPSPVLRDAKQGALSEVETFVKADGNSAFENTDAIMDAIFGDLRKIRTSEELNAMERIIKDVIDGQATPEVQFADNGDIHAGNAQTLLPDGVLGAFVAGEDGQPGTILISRDIKNDPVELARVMLEEVGEAIGAHAEHHPQLEGLEPAAGDIGNRIMQVVRGAEIDDVAFVVTDGGLDDDHPDFDPERVYDERNVLFNGAVVAARTATDDVAFDIPDAMVLGNEEGAAVSLLPEDEGATGGQMPDTGTLGLGDDWGIGLPTDDEVEDAFYPDSSLDASEAVQADILADNPNAKVREGYPDLDWMGRATELTVEDLDLDSGPAIRVTGTWEVEQSVGGRQGAAGLTEIVEVSDSVTLKVKQVGDQKYLEVMLPGETPNAKNLEEDRTTINPTYVGSSKENAAKQFKHVKQAIAAAPATDQPTIHYSYENNYIHSSLPYDAEEGGGLLNVDDGVWHDFGYYGDGDGDTVINGADDGFADRSYDLVDIPTTAGLPKGVVLDTVQDFGTGTHTFGVQDVRIVTYTGPVYGGGIARVIDMTEGSSTYGQAIQTMLAPPDGSVELYMGDDDVAALTFSADDMAAMETENDERRRLNDGPSVLLEGVVSDLEADGIGAENIIQEYDDPHIAYVTYKGSDGTLQIRYRHQPSFMAMMADPGEFVANQVIGGTFTEGDEAWDKLQEATDALEGFYASSDIRQNAANGASIGGKAGGAVGGAIGVLFGASAGALAASVFGVIGGAAGWIAGSALGGIANVVAGGTKALYHGLQSASLLDELDVLAGTPISEGPTGGTVAATDPGVLGTGYAAYWYPQDATIISNETLLAEDGPYGVDTKQYVYIRGDDPSTIYSAAVDISDPEGARHGLVLHGTATDWDKQPDGTILSDVTVYDSTGNALETVEDLDLPSVSEPLEEEDILGHPEAFLEHAESKLPEDAIIQESGSVANATYIEYTVPGVQGTKVFKMIASKNDDGTIHSENSTGWVSDSTYADFKKGFGYLQEAAREFLDLKTEYDGAVLSGKILQYMAQNIDYNAIAALFSSGANPHQTAPQAAATTLMTASIAGLLPYAQDALGLGIQWAALHQVPSDIALGGICMSRAMGRATTDVQVQGETGDIENQIVEDNPNADVVDPPEEFRAEKFTYFETEVNNWIDNNTGTQIATDLNTNTYATLEMPYWVMGEIENVALTREAPDRKTIKSEDYHIENNPELTGGITQLMQQTVDKNIADGKMPAGAVATVEDGKHFIRNFTSTGVTHVHQDPFPALINEEGHELVGAYTILTTANNGQPTQVLHPDHRDKVKRNPDFVPAMEMEEWIAIDGGSMDRYMTWSQTPELLIFEGRPDADLRTQYESLVHRSPPNELDRTIYEIKVAVYAPPADQLVQPEL